jgi:signal transduction histidine kinase
LDPAEHDRLLGVVIRNAKRLQRLADSILDVARIDSNSLKLNKEKININDVIVDVIVDYRDQIGKSENQRLTCELIAYDNKQDIITVEADRERLSQLISNLLSNAIKFTKDIKGGEDRVISIDAKRTKRRSRRRICSCQC